MRGGKSKTKKNTSRSVMGKLMSPVDIREDSQLKELEDRIKIGPVTLVLVYADWCGHCQRFKPMMEKLENVPGRTIQTARIRDDMFPKSSLSSAKIEGYPTLMLVEKSGKIASFKNENGQMTNAIPDHTNMENMTAIVRNAGKNEGVKLLKSANKEKEENEEEEEESTLSVEPLNAKNLSGNAKEAPNNIVADRFSPESVSKLNSNLINSQNALLKETSGYERVKPSKMQLGGSGSLWSSLMIASQKLAPAAALFLASDAIRRRKSRKAKKSRKVKKSKKVTRRTRRR
jgi:thiol-disulfide isomerase/thioredoxin